MTDKKLCLKGVKTLQQLCYYKIWCLHYRMRYSKLYRKEACLAFRYLVKSSLPKLISEKLDEFFFFHPDQALELHIYLQNNIVQKQKFVNERNGKIEEIYLYPTGFWIEKRLKKHYTSTY